MTMAPERPMLAACDCDTRLVCGHCACDRCEDCYGCTACGCCAGEQTACDAMWDEKLAELYLGTHERHWLHDEQYEESLKGLTLFVSRVRLAERKSAFPKALHPYCIDSGGFSELQKHGRWTITAAEYVAEIRRYLSELGPELCKWVAQMDYMTEKIVIEGGMASRGVRFHGTRELRGLKPGDPEQDFTAAVRIHQRLTVDNYVELVSLAPEIRFIPVLQGQLLEDYEYCDQLFREAGVDLSKAPVVGLGSVCRRQATAEIEEIVNHFHAKGYRLHGFGVKTLGLERYASKLVSADSMAWSDDARRSPEGPLPGHTHKNCANCPDWAIRWHRRIVQQHLTPAA
jgi:hypothetical protein